MAQKYLVQLVDDLTGDVLEDGAGESLSFSFDGINYTIDLSTKNAEALRATVAPYVAAGRRDSGTTPRAPKRIVADKRDLPAIREWASANGHAVSSRGRIAKTIQDAYDAAH